MPFPNHILVEPAPIQEIIDANVVSTLVGFLDPGVPEQLQFEASWCVTNIAAGKKEHIQCLTEKGVVPKFVALLNSRYQPLQDQASTLSNVCARRSGPWGTSQAKTMCTETWS